MKKIPILIMLLSGMTLSSQPPTIVFDEITFNEGLNSFRDISDIIQDHHGFIWIGSRSGLERYDGYEFKNYFMQALFVLDIMEDSRGLLWISSMTNGIFLLNPEDDKMMHFIPDSAKPTMNEVLEDGNGVIWCAYQGGLIKMEPKNEDKTGLKKLIFENGLENAFYISVFKYDSTLLQNLIYDIYEDSRGRLWAGSENGLYFFNDETKTFIRLDDDDHAKTRLDHQRVWSIAEEGPDVIWVRNQYGFSRISNINGAFSDITVNKADLEITNYSCEEFNNSIYFYAMANTFIIDNQKNFLFGTPNNGLITMTTDENHVPEYTELHKDVHDPGYRYGVIMSILQDRTGLIWVGNEYVGIKKFRFINDLFEPLESMLYKYPIIRYNFNQTYEDEEGNLWVCSWGNGLFKISPDGKTLNYNIEDSEYPGPPDGNQLITLVEIEKGIFWLGGDGLWQLNTNTGTCEKLFAEIDYLDVIIPNVELDVRINRIHRIDNYIILGTWMQGLWIYNLNNARLERYVAEQNDTTGLPSNFLYSICEMKNGEIWIATNMPVGISRIRLNKTTGEIDFVALPETVTQNKKVLLEDSQLINQIYEDKSGIIWFCTETGLVRLDLRTGETRKWTDEDGLSTSVVIGIIEDNNGMLWLTTTDDIAVLNPVTEKIKTFRKNDGVPSIRNELQGLSMDKKGRLIVSGVGGFYRVNPDRLWINNNIPSVMITEFRLNNQPVVVDSTRKAILTKNISYTQEIKLKYNQNDISFTFAALDYNDPSKNEYAYILEGYQDEWIETDAANRTAAYTNLNPGEYTFRVKGSNNEGIWNEEGALVRIIIHPPIWKTVWAYIVYGIFILLLLRGYIFWRTRRLRKEKIVLEKQVSERTQQIEMQKEDLKTANIRLKEHEQELEATNIKLKKNQQELQEVNTLLEEQKEELMQQKEELQSTLENLQKTQEQLVESEKMAAVGGLVAGVAHEINTPVGIGITAISNLKDEIHRMSGLYDQDEISREDFKDFLQSSQGAVNLIQKNLERTASLVQSFKQVSTDQVTEQQRVFEFREYLDDIMASLRPKFSGKKIDFKIECDDKLKLNSYPGVYAQIFTNLLLNSLQHGFYEKDKGIINIKAEMDKELMKIQYRDDGAGIREKDLPHIFEPFYTSDQHRGTGLGLNIIYNLVRQKLHGTITCESEQGKGVFFKIEVPVK